MVTIADKIEKINRDYYLATDETTLDSACAALARVLSDRDISEKNKDNALALSFRLKAKFLVVGYFENGYDPKDCDELIEFLAEAIEKSTAGGYAHTTKTLSALAEFISALKPIMNEAYARHMAMYNDDGEFVGGRDDALGAAEFFDGAIKSLQKREVGNPFGSGVKLFDLKARALSDLTAEREKTLRYSAEIERAALDRFFKDNIIEVKPEYVGYLTYFPVFNERLSAGAIVLRTPFESEAELYALSEARDRKTRLGKVSGRALGGAGGDLSRVFDILASEGRDCIVVGFDGCPNKGDVLAAAMKSGHRGARIYILDDGIDGTAYELAMEMTKDDGELSVLDIGCRYLTMPYLRDVAELFESKGMADGTADRDRIRETMPFAGYVGLNRACAAYVAGEDFWETARRISDENLSAATSYIRELPSLSQLIGTEWQAEELVEGRRSSGVVGERREVDYDDIEEISGDNIKRILSSRGSFFAKCGALSRYCLLGGNDISMWELVDSAEKSERFTTATRVIMRMLDAGDCINVKVVSDEEWAADGRPKSAGAQCCEGGKLMVYRESSVKGFDWAVGAVCHECFHAFQHRAIETGAREWYFTELGVTQGRIDEWNYNFGDGHYADSDKPQIYNVEIVEADARAFENECKRQGKDLWNRIDFQ